ncbi:MAG TPA: arylesterase, partial [Aliiroseovarius sp.]|nr:arylesterase [Aliiroseovarius sp.]
MAVFALMVTAASARAETVILAFGDSLTQGYGLSPDQGFVGQLQTWLSDAGGDVRLINGGVSGDTTAGGAARIAWSLTDEVNAVIVELGGNDMLRGLPPQEASENLRAILDQISARGLPVLLVGLPAPANFGAQYQHDFAAIYPALAEEYGVMLYPDFLQALHIEENRETVMRNLMQGDGIHQNAEGVARIVAAIGPEVQALV